MSGADLVLGYDFGTSGVKAALFGSDGRMHASRRAGYPTRHPEPGAAEQDPRDWWRAMGEATRHLLAALPGGGGRVAALGLGAQMCGCIPADSAGEPLHPCLLWSDTRSAPLAREITAGGPRIAGYGVLALARWLWLANGVPSLAGRDPLSKMLWLRRERPDVWGRAAFLLDAKDWLLQRCIGRAATTPDVAQLTWLMDNRRRCWSDSFLAKHDIARDKLPVIVEAAAIAGELTSEAAAHLGLPPGLPVSGGAGDVNASALGTGDFGEGAYHLYLGTSLWVAAHSRRRRVDVLTGTGTLCAALSDRYLLVATDDYAGSTVNRVASTLGFGSDATGLRALDTAAAGISPHGGTPLVAPGAVPVLPSHAGRSDLAYGVLAGVALSARRAFTHGQRCLKSSSRAIRVTGGGAESGAWMRIVADMLQQPLQIMEAPLFSGARGAAMTAATAAAWFPRLADCAPMAPLGRVIEPDAARRSWADDRYEELIGRSENA